MVHLEGASDVLTAGTAAAPTLNVPARVLLAPFCKLWRGRHEALGQADACDERDLMLAAGAGCADETGGEENGNHDVLQFAPSSLVSQNARRPGCDWPARAG